MIRGGKILLMSGGLAAASCGIDHNVEVRAIPQPGAKWQYGGGLLAEARAQLALGSAGLALESFRKLQREQPESADTYAGIAACYATMGRYDLTRANYEFALAYAPNDPALLNALANTLERLGEAEQAANVRAEAVRNSAVPARLSRQQLAVTPSGVPRVSSVTVKLPPASGRPADVARAAIPATAAIPVSPAPSLRPVPNKRSLNEAVEVAIASTHESGRAPIAFEPELNHAPAETPRQVAISLAENRGPYMQRISSGEVALVTSSPPVPLARLATRVLRPDALAHTKVLEAGFEAAPVQARTRPVVAAVRWVPLKYESASANIRLLNAARSEGLAARSRVALLDNGWRKIRIGNAREVRERSLVLYSPARAAIARRLAAHFRCRAVKTEGVKNVIVLLGRDAASGKLASSRA